MNNPNQHIVIQRPNDLSVQWAQRILSRYVQDAKVSKVKIHSVDVGTSTRLRVEVSHDAPDALPARWFVKTPSLALKPRLITALPRFLHKEISFYRSLSAGVPLKLPRILAAESRFGRGSTLVMTDLAEHEFRPGLAADALTFEQASQVISHLAQLHARYWNKPELVQGQRWLTGFSHQLENHMGMLLAVPLMRQGLLRASKLISKKMWGQALPYAKNRRHIKQLLAEDSKTLVHYDCHPGNIFWTQAGPGFLDWQLVRLGEGIGDVAYFLATALDPQLRRAHEKSLINLYVRQLASAGVNNLNERMLFRRYQMHLVYPFEAMVVTLGIGGMMQHETNLELIRRAAAAVEDHDSFALIKI